MIGSYLIWLAQMPLFARVGLEVQGLGVDTVAQASLILWTIFKDMTQVTTAASTDGFHAAHTVAGVFPEFDVSFADDVPKAGPA